MTMKKKASPDIIFADLKGDSQGNPNFYIATVI
jgi:hypothetical protein